MDEKNPKPGSWILDTRMKIEKNHYTLPVARIKVKPNELNENRMCCNIIENGLIFENDYND